MGHAIQWLRSLIFNAQIYGMMAIMAVVYLPYTIYSRDGALKACHAYAAWVLWTLRWIVGLKVEVRGTPPSEACLVAAKHQSFLDIFQIYSAVPSARFIMKRLLLYTPIFGQYVYRLGCIPVHRGKRGKAIAQMVKDVGKSMDRPGQLVIYPQGTRVAPGDHKPYKVGVGILYEELGQRCYPVATNVGLFWPKRGILRMPGTAVVEFLEPIEPGLSKEEFMALLEERIEGRSNALMAEAGFEVAAPPAS
jgi:1-acyl-sn-glycerol-3-phosphate acyltransferase